MSALLAAAAAKKGVSGRKNTPKRDSAAEDTVVTQSSRSRAKVSPYMTSLLHGGTTRECVGGGRRKRAKATVSSLLLMPNEVGNMIADFNKMKKDLRQSEAEAESSEDSYDYTFSEGDDSTVASDYCASLDDAVVKSRIHQKRFKDESEIVLKQMGDKK